MASDPTAIMSIISSFKGKTAFDIGANDGEVTDILLKNFDLVIAFEPQPEFYRRLTEKYQGNHRVVVLDYALSDNIDNPKEYAIRRNSQNQFTSPVNSFLIKQWGEVISTATPPTMTIDIYTEQTGLRPDFMKIDTEGAEYDIIRGGFHYLISALPRLFIEIHSEENGRKIQSLLPDLKVVRHPHYRKDSEEYLNHHFLIR